MGGISVDRRGLLALATSGAAAVGLAGRVNAAPATGLKVIAEITAKPEYADRIRQALTAFAASTRSEPGCIHYDLYEDAGRPGRFFTYETWTDAAALDAHLNSPAMKAAGPKLGAMLAEPPSVNRLQPLSVS